MPYHLTIGNHQPRKLNGEGTAPSNCAVQSQSSAGPSLKLLHSGSHLFGLFLAALLWTKPVHWLFVMASAASISVSEPIQ